MYKMGQDFLDIRYNYIHVIANNELILSIHVLINFCRILEVQFIRYISKNNYIQHTNICNHNSRTLKTSLLAPENTRKDHDPIDFISSFYIWKLDSDLSYNKAGPNPID